MKNTLTLLIFLTFAYSLAQNTVTDIDGNTYKTVVIGQQEWMAENLSVSKFRNGDPIPQAKNDADWQKAKENKTPAWSFYEYNPENDKIYGKLYNWYAVNDPRGLSPEGYMIPRKSHWELLAQTFTLNDFSHENLKAENGWYHKNGNNSSGFSAQANGYRKNEKIYTDKMGKEFIPPSFAEASFRAYWWSSTEISKIRAWGWALDHNFQIIQDGSLKAHGFAVRSIKGEDDGQNDYSKVYKKGEGVKDVDGNFYETIIINDQEWMTQNLRVSHYTDGTSIDNITDDTEWRASTRRDSERGGWRNYEDNEKHDIVYGKIYNYQVIKSSQQICPEGWRVTSKDDWDELIEFLGGVSDYLVGDFFKSTGSVSEGDGLWEKENFSLNLSGLNCLPGGTYSNGFSGFGNSVNYWVDDDMGLRNLNLTASRVSFSSGGSGNYIRCVKEIDFEVVNEIDENERTNKINSKDERKKENSKDGIKKVFNEIKGLFKEDK